MGAGGGVTELLAVVLTVHDAEAVTVTEGVPEVEPLRVQVPVTDTLFEPETDPEEEPEGLVEGEGGGRFDGVTLTELVPEKEGCEATWLMASPRRRRMTRAARTIVYWVFVCGG
jgi:hypothetical protein